MEDLFGIDPFPKGQSLALAQHFHVALQRMWDGDDVGVADLGELLTLVKNAETVRDRRPLIYDHFRALLARAPTNAVEHYTGAAFELRIAAHLISKSIAFELGADPPDFEITGYERHIGIECYAPRVFPGDDVRKRMKQAVLSKGKAARRSAWRSGPAALLIDATWLRRADVGKEVPPGQIEDELETGFRDAVRSTDFDLVIAMWFGHAVGHPEGDMDSIQIRSSLSTDPPEELKAFLLDFTKGFQIANSTIVRLPDIPT